MLRFIVLLLLIANGLFFAWSKGYLSQWGLALTAQHESFRLQEQIEPERLVIRQMDTAAIQAPIATATATASAPTAPLQTAPAAVCLTAGAFNDKQSSILKKTLEANLLDFRWRFEAVNVPENWIIYMGKYPNNQARDIKKKQLEQIKVNYEVLREGKLEPGMSLGNHPTQAAANQALQALVKKGVRTARVLQDFPEQKGQQLIVSAIDESNRTKLNALYSGLASQLSGKNLQVCK